MRLLIDMNLTPRWVHDLSDAGHEVLHWSAIGNPAASDFPHILAYTRESGPSVVLLRAEPLVPESCGPALLAALRECESELAKGAIVSLDWSGRPRARVLPLL